MGKKGARAMINANQNKYIARSKQRGVVLFVALIALLVLSLAAVGLVRSVDTSSLIAGNLAFKQSAAYSADHGIETAMLWLKANEANLDNDNPAEGYYAALATNPAGLPNTPENETKAFFANETWEEDKSRAASGDQIDDATGEEESSGNKIRYIVQRMCKTIGEAKTTATQQCLYGAGEGGGNPNNQSIYSSPLLGEDSQSPMYRVTVKVIGPKNTESYTQAFVF